MISGHAGSAAMKSQARNIVFWLHIDSDIEQIIKIALNVSQTFPLIHKSKEMFISKWPETNESQQRLHVDWAIPINENYFLDVFDPHSNFRMYII